MRRVRRLLAIAALGLLATAPAAVAYEPTVPPWLEEWEKNPPGMPPLPVVEVPASAPGPVIPPADLTPPDTFVSAKRAFPRAHSARFSFDSDDPSAAFVCRLDQRPPVTCASPDTFRNLSPGAHSLAVAAVDESGNVDPTPATARIKLQSSHPVGRGSHN
jgi:hypothetical protein